jgi:hypothetical protein
MTEADIYDAFCVALTAFAAQSSPAIPVAYPDVHFTPPDTGVWLEARFFPNETDNYGLANDGGSVHKGFLQVGICYRSGAGLANTLTMLASVLDEFAKGTILGPARIDRKPWASAVLQMDDKNVVPVTIPYHAFIVAAESAADVDNLLLESGDNLLLESGDFLLLESA